MKPTIAELLAQAWALRREGRAEQALAMAQAAFNAAQEIGPGLELCRSLYVLGALHRDGERMQEALGYYKQGLEVAREQGLAHALAHGLRHVGDIHTDSERPAKAVPLLLQALELYLQLENPNLMDRANTHYALLRAYHLLGQAHELSQHKAQARALYQEAGLEVDLSAF